MAEFVRAQARTLKKRLAETRRFMQVIAGPRQSGNEQRPEDAQAYAGAEIEARAARRGAVC